MVTSNTDMEKKVSSLLDRFKYVKACFCDQDVLALETVNLSKETVQEEFCSSSKQEKLCILLDIAYTASMYPESDSRILRLNFLQQFLYEVEYVCSPESVRTLRSGEIVNWKPSIQMNYSYDLVLPHIYKSFGKVKFVFLRVSTTNFDLHAVKVISVCCSMFIRILENLKMELRQLSPTELIVVDNIIKNIVALVLSPLVDILEEVCQKVVKRAFLDNMCQ